MAEFDDVLDELEILDVDVDKTTVSNVVKKYGFFPYSVWRVKSNKQMEELCGDDIATGTYMAKSQKSMIGKSAQKKKGYTGVANGLSRFNTEVAKRLVNYYTDEGDVVLTPFGSRGIITIIAAHLGRKGVVYEIHPKYASHIQNQIDRLNNKKSLIKKHYDAVCYCGNANNMEMIDDDSIDCVITSPPFWDIEKYESCEGQLSDIDDYYDFLEEYQLCLNEIYRVMKPGGFAIFVVNDFRKSPSKGEKSRLIRFSRDTEIGMEKAGFETYDIGINFLYSTPSVIGVNKRAELRQLLKSHEYILVFRK
jgi:DNA modification methylase